MRIKFKIFFMALPFMGCCLSVGAQNDYKMKPVQLQSRWAKDVSPENTHNQYPRPQLSRAKWTNLNGLWEYAITAKDAAAPVAFEGQILVPYPIESALSGVKRPLLPDQNLWYKRTILKPALGAGERLLLNFGAVDWQATVFVNGKQVGMHTGGYTAFKVDLTSALKTGLNEIIVKVFDPTNTGIGPHGKQVLNPENIYYTPSSGIWQTVWMEVVPKVSIDKLIMTPDIDKGVLNLQVDLSAVISTQAGISAEIFVIVNGKEILKQVQDNLSQNIGLKIQNARLWSPDDPFLYDLVIKLKKNGKVVDVVKSYFGMRKVAIQKDEKGFDRIFLNNEYTYNLGTLDQGFWPEGLYTAPTDEALAFDIKAIKAMGFNTIRKHIKVEPARWYYHADKIGMLVWQDMVNPNQGLPAGSREEFESESKDIITQLHNYPSITTWVLFNEKWGQYDQARLTKWLKDADPSRIVNGHSGEYLYVNNQLRSPNSNPYINSDITDVHSYPQPMNSLRIDGKAQICGEFGGIGVPVPGHQWNDLTGWGYIQVLPKDLDAKYDGMVKELKKLEIEGLSGSIYTQPFDVEGEENGLMTYDREVIKIPLGRLRDINHQLISTNFKTVDKSFFIGETIDPTKTDEMYPELISLYENGQRDSTFLRRISLMAIRKGDQKNAARFAITYLQHLKNIYTIENLNFIKQIARKAGDPGFEIFRDNADQVDAVLGKNAARNFKNGLVLKEIMSTIFSTTESPNVDKIESDIIGKYGVEARGIVWDKIAVFYYLNKQTENWIAMKRKIFEKYPEVTSTFHLNNDAWFLFEHSFDQSQLETALIWSNRVLIQEPKNPNWFDTNANILYKLGRKEEAIRVQQQALALSIGGPYENEIRSNLEKMKSGEKTWPN